MNARGAMAHVVGAAARRGLVRSAALSTRAFTDSAGASAVERAAALHSFDAHSAWAAVLHAPAVSTGDAVVARWSRPPLRALPAGSPSSSALGFDFCPVSCAGAHVEHPGGAMQTHVEAPGAEGAAEGLWAMNRNMREPRKSNHGARPCSSVRRRRKYKTRVNPHPYMPGRRRKGSDY